MTAEQPETPAPASPPLADRPPVRRPRRRPITITTEVDVDIDEADLEEAGWVYVGEGRTPEERNRVGAIVLRWHDETHPDPLKVCAEQPCRDLREAGEL